MSGFIAAALVVSAAVVVEIVFPGQSVYHAGWYSVALTALLVAAVLGGRRQFGRARGLRRRLAILTVVAGTAIVGFAGVTSGLLAPDNQTYVGAPGQRIRVQPLGVLVFPLLPAETAATGTVRLERSLRAPIRIGGHARDAGDFILHTIMRTVVYVEARDLSGGRLTVTQPSGSVFLSPVLLMQHRQAIAGMDLPYDSFNVPAARRIVKAVMFTPAQAAMLLHRDALIGEPAVLFAVDDENERPLRHAIALSAGDKAARAGGLLLRGVVASYPAVEVIAAPNVVATAFGAVLILGGLIALVVP